VVSCWSVTQSPLTLDHDRCLEGDRRVVSWSVTQSPLTLDHDHCLQGDRRVVSRDTIASNTGPRLLPGGGIEEWLVVGP